MLTRYVGIPVVCYCSVQWCTYEVCCLLCCLVVSVQIYLFHTIDIAYIRSLFDSLYTIFQLNGHRRFSNDSRKELPFRDPCFRVVDESVELATEWIFKVGDIFVLSDLQDLVRRFGLAWNFVSSRNGRKLTCNRASRSSPYISTGVRKSSSIVCGCGWLVRFKGVN